jgi:hypothetical protein
MKTVKVVCVLSVVFGIAVSASAETIAYWPFGTNGFHDVSGNGHDLTGNGIAESEAAYLVLNQDAAAGQYLKTAAALDLSGETAVTFECWWRQTPEKPNGWTSLIMASANPSTGTGGFFVANNGGIQSQLRTATGGWHLDNSGGVRSDAWNDGMWHHLACVIDRSKSDHTSCRLYLDGVEQNSAGTTGGAPFSVPALFNDDFLIGGGSATYEAGKNCFRGYIDDVRISRGALAPEDFLKYPTVGKRMRADDGKLPVVAYWPFGGRRGKDATGNGFDLTMDDTVPMLSGTPNPQYPDRTKWANFYLPTFPFSAFSKTGLTIECFARSGSNPGGDTFGNILVVSSQWYAYPGAFRFGYEGSDAVSTSFKRVGVSFLTPGKGYAASKTSEAAFGAMNDNKWRHLAVVYDPTKTGPGLVTLYVDGIAATDSTETSATQGAFALRDDILKFCNGLFGQIDDVRMTAGVLTPDKFLVSRSVGSTVALYRFNQKTLDDFSGNGTELVLENGSATYGDGGYPESGTGLVMSGVKGGREWLHTAETLDLTHTKGLTVEFDFNGPIPGEEDSSSLYVMASSANATTEAGGFVVYRTNGDKLQGQLRKDSQSWIHYYASQVLGDAGDGYHRGRYTIDATVSGKSSSAIWANGTKATQTTSIPLSSLGNLQFCFGHCPTYYGSTSTEPCYFKGKYLRIAVSDVVLDSADFVLDNIVDPEAKGTLTYWNFANFDGLTAPGVNRRGGALFFDGTASAATTNLTLSALTQATIECFVCFGETPSSGTVLSLGSGVGSFAIASDATAGTLSGSFVPYDHLAASNGGAAALAPLAGKKAWHHVALVIDRTKPGADAVRFYVDYVRAMPAGRAWDNAATMLDGAIAIGSGFTGRIDDLRVSAGALAPGEFLQADQRTEVPDGFSLIVR